LSCGNICEMLGLALCLGAFVRAARGGSNDFVIVTSIVVSARSLCERPADLLSTGPPFSLRTPGLGQFSISGSQSGFQLKRAYIRFMYNSIDRII
jgi:hypothetical protein